MNALWAYVRNKGEKSYPETDESGQFWRSTLLDIDSRLRVARGMGKDETQASIEVFRLLQQRGHPEHPPPVISDGWGGIDQAMVEVYGCVPEYGGRGRPPARKKPGSDWMYLQMVKQRDEHGRFQGTKLRVIFGTKAEVVALLGKSTAYIERSNLTSRLFDGRQVRKTLAFSKDIQAYRAAAIWEDSYYNLIRPHKSLRLPVQDDLPRKWSPRTPAMAAKLTDHIWTVKELFMTLPLPGGINT
ncbi:MAG: transposase [Chloroflexota bacterium]